MNLLRTLGPQLLSGVVCFLLTTAEARALCTDYSTHIQQDSLEPGLAEVSGIVASRSHPGIFWAHNDSGDTSRIFAFYFRCGEAISLGYYALTGVAHVDWEDISIGPGPDGNDWIYLGDIGNNRNDRADRNLATTRALRILRFPEPDIEVPIENPSSPTPGQIGSIGSSAVEILPFLFAAAPGQEAWEVDYDSESLAVHPNMVPAQIYLLTKRRNPNYVTGSWEAVRHIFRFMGNDSKWRAYSSISSWSDPSLKTTAVYLSDPSGTSSTPTGMDISPDGQRLAIRNYSTGYVYTLLSGQPFEQIWTTAPDTFGCAEAQGEAIAFSHDGNTIWTASEDSRALYKVNCSDAPFIRDVIATEVTYDSSQLEWNTRTLGGAAVASTAQVRWGSTIAMENTIDVTEAKTGHNVELRPLAAGTPYLYSITSQSGELVDTYDCAFEFTGEYPTPTPTPTSTSTSTSTPTPTPTNTSTATRTHTPTPSPFQTPAIRPTSVATPVLATPTVSSPSPSPTISPAPQVLQRSAVFVQAGRYELGLRNDSPETAAVDVIVKSPSGTVKLKTTVVLAPQESAQQLIRVGGPRWYVVLTAPAAVQATLRPEGKRTNRFTSLTSVRSNGTSVLMLTKRAKGKELLLLNHEPVSVRIELVLRARGSVQKLRRRIGAGAIYQVRLPRELRKARISSSGSSVQALIVD